MRTIILLMALAVLVAGCSQTEDAMMEEPAMMEEAQMLAPHYETFTKEAYDQATAEGKVILLYFYADWCPICKAEEPDAMAAYSEVDSQDFIAFRVNYRDASTDEYEEALAKEYGVTYQHTKVIIKNGKQVVKAPDSWDKQRYLDEIGNVL